MTVNSKFAAIKDALLVLDEERVVELIKESLDEGVEPMALIQDALAPGMTEVGDRFEKGEFFLPELLIAADVFTKTLDVLKPLLAKGEASGKGTIVIGTVEGDIHEIGKNVVKIMLEVEGFDVHDLGIDVTADAFLKAQEETGAQIIAASALLTSTMPRLGEIVEAVNKESAPARVLIGGAPVRAELADRIGADGYAPDAVSACRVAADLV